MNRKQFLTFIGLIFTTLLILCVYLISSSSITFSQQIKVGASYMTMNNDFYKVLNAEIEKQLSQDGDIFYARDSELDETKQSQQIDYFVEKQVDVIVLNPVKSDGSGLEKSLERARKEGIKIIVVDSPLEDRIKVDSTIVSDNTQAGVLIAQDMMSKLSSAKILLLEHRSTRSAIDRVDGFLETIKGHPAYQVVSQRETLGQTEDSMPQVQEVLEQGTDFNVVMALNDRTAIGALAAMKDKGVTNPVYIYGIDGSPEMKYFLANTDDIEATVYQSPIAMGEKVAEVIQRMSQGKDYQSQYVIPVGLMTQENVNQFSITGWQ